MTYNAFGGMLSLNQPTTTITTTTTTTSSVVLLAV